jgi:hypothetical protein
MYAYETGLRVRLRRPLGVTVAVATLAAFFGVTQGFANTPTAKATPASFTMPRLKADRILVLKSARKLELLKDGVVLKTYPIALGANPVGPKRAGGDGKTPEGVYTRFTSPIRTTRTAPRPPRRIVIPAGISRSTACRLGIRGRSIRTASIRIGRMAASRSATTRSRKSMPRSRSARRSKSGPDERSTAAVRRAR